MSIRVNLLANYVGQLYSALIGILLVPLYVEYLGIEAYGLVGFYTALQGWFMLLDAGLTPAIGREAARFNAGAIDVLRLRRLLRSLEGIVVVIGAMGAAAVALGANFVANHWLSPEQLRPKDVAFAITLMGAIVALRWISGLYRAAIGGLEHIVWLSGFSVLASTARFVLVIPVLHYAGSTPGYFFAYQLAVAVLEVMVLVGQTYRALPPVQQRIRWEFQPVLDVLPFVLSSGLASVVWVLVTQTDKFLLSGMIPLTQYAYFSMAVLIASGVTLLTTPISGALVPRLTRLGASGDSAGLTRLYRDATQLAAVLATPLVLVLAFFPEQVLVAWTGTPDAAEECCIRAGAVCDWQRNPRIGCAPLLPADRQRQPCPPHGRQCAVPLALRALTVLRCETLRSARGRVRLDRSEPPAVRNVASSSPSSLSQGIACRLDAERHSTHPVVPGPLGRRAALGCALALGHPVDGSVSSSLVHGIVDRRGGQFSNDQKLVSVARLVRTNGRRSPLHCIAESAHS